MVPLYPVRRPKKGLNSNIVPSITGLATSWKTSTYLASGPNTLSKEKVCVPAISLTLLSGLHYKQSHSYRFTYRDWNLLGIIGYTLLVVAFLFYFVLRPDSTHNLNSISLRHFKLYT